MTDLASQHDTFSSTPERAFQVHAEIGEERCRLEYVEGAVWDEIAAGFNDVVHEQTHFFNTLRWGDSKTENVVFKLDDEIIGGASVIVVRVPLSTTGLAVVKWGPLWRKQSGQPQLSRLKSMLALLQQEYAQRRGYYLTIVPHGDPEHSTQICTQLKQLGFTPGASLTAPERYLVNTDQSAEDLHKSLDQKWRYNLKKSGKHDFQIEFSTDNKAFDTFIELYEEMLSRKQFMDSSAIYTLKGLMQNTQPAFKPSIVLVSQAGKTIAGGVFDLSGERAVYLYGATDSRAVSLRAGYALHWWIASHLCSLPHCRWYDLGGNDMDRGLHQFKKGFTGKTGSICITPPVYHYAVSLPAHLIGRAVFQAREIKALVSRKLHAVKARLKT